MLQALPLISKHFNEVAANPCNMRCNMLPVIRSCIGYAHGARLWQSRRPRRTNRYCDDCCIICASLTVVDGDTAKCDGQNLLIKRARLHSLGCVGRSQLNGLKGCRWKDEIRFNRSARFSSRCHESQPSNKLVGKERAKTIHHVLYWPRAWFITCSTGQP